MADSKHVRFSDSAHFQNAKKDEFVTRKNTPLQQISRLFMLLMIVVLGVAILVYYNSLTGCWLAAGVGIVILYVARKLERVEKIQHSTEFLNALFSSALGRKYKFCTIVKVDNGEIVYLNRAFQSMFPGFLKQPKRNLETLFSMQGVSAETTGMINKLIAGGTDSTLSVTVNGGPDNAPQSVSLSIEPIERPSGFVLLRGQ